MSLLINNIQLNNFAQTSTFNSEKEEKEIKVFLSAFKTKQKLVNDKILFLSLAKNVDKINIIKLLNKNFLNDLTTIKKKKFKDFIQYIIHLSILKKNTAIHVTDVKGQLKMFCSASSSLKLSGKQKTFQPKVLIALIKYLINKAYFLKNKDYFSKEENLPIALHSKQLHRNLLKLTINRIKKKISIKTIRFSNFYPYNGCRNKKIKRFKRRKKNKRTKKIFFHADSNKKIWKSFFKLKKKSNKYVKSRKFSQKTDS